MRALQLVLRVLAIAFVAVAALHLTLGMQADLMLGVPVSAQMAADPSLDSQNRFYGVTFSLLGIALWISLQDLRRYEPIVVATLAVLFAAGLARAVAWGLHGAPSPALIGITAVDLLLPPMLIVWLRRSLRAFLWVSVKLHGRMLNHCTLSLGLCIRQQGWRAGIDR